MTELEKIEYAKNFIDKLAIGLNPIDNSPIPEGEVANNVRISRCFSYVSDILKQVIDNGGVTPVKKPRVKKVPFALTSEQYECLTVSDVPLGVSDMIDHINSLIDTETMKKLTTRSITNWLVEIGVLEVVQMPNGKNRKLPTQTGYGMGIITEERQGQYGPYTVVLYTATAQRFIYDNIDAFATEKD